MTEGSATTRHGDSVRLDAALVARGQFESRAKARQAIEAGLVRVDGEVARKPATPVAITARLDAVAPHPWVSRGGLKLAAGLDRFGIAPAARVCLDVGASTGGFTDVLLERGAAYVHAVDVGRDQLHPRLAADPRVSDRSATDIRALRPGDLRPAPDLMVCDASFISLHLVLLPALALTQPACDLVALIKPQFEVGPGKVHKGIVRDVALQTAVCDDITALVTALGLEVLGLMPSPIMGRDGNAEFLIAARRA